MITRIRVLNQRHEIKKAKEALLDNDANDTAWGIMDFKMKYTPVRYRETTQQHFAKRGMSWNGIMILYRKPNHDRYTETESKGREREEFDVMYFDYMSTGDTTQDYFMVLSGLEAMLHEIHKELPHIKSIVLQSDNARCYQSSALIYGIVLLNMTSPIKVRRFIHTETQDGKCSLDAHFAVAMAHVLRYVAMGNNVITPTQLVMALNSNGGVRNTKPVLYAVNREQMNLFETEHATELKRYLKLKRSNDIFFGENDVRAHNYSGLEADYVIQLRSTDHEASGSEREREEGEEEEEEEYEDGFYDNEDDSLVQNETIVASDNSYYESDANPEDYDTADSSTYFVGQVTKVSVIEPEEILRKSRRWKAPKQNKRRGTIDERLIQPIPATICSVCCRVFKSAAFKNLHKCRGRKDPQDIISFAILEAERLIKGGEFRFIQSASSMNDLAASQGTIYQSFDAGWARRPRNGQLYGKKYISKYTQDIVQMFQDGVDDISKRRGPNRIREVLLKRYPGALDIPSETEIRNAITAMMTQQKKGQAISLGSRRGRKSSFPPILEYILSHYINQNRNTTNGSALKPTQALIFCKETYVREYEHRFPISDDSMPEDAKIKQRFSDLKQKLAKYGHLEETFPYEPSDVQG